MKQSQIKKNLQVFSVILLVLLLLLGIKLVIVQIFYSDVYQTKAKQNRIRLLPIKPARGEIYDRNGAMLAANKLVYNLTLTYTGVGQQDEMVDELRKIVKPYYPEVNEDYIKEKIETQRLKLFEPVIIIRDISWDLVVKIEEKRKALPGVVITEEPFRLYPEGNLAGHVLGYIHSITPTELENSDGKYDMNSLIGKSGIEKEYETDLRGEDGARVVEVDAQGRPVREPRITKEAKPGSNLTLTIDAKLQKVMEKSLDDTLKNLQKKHPKAKVGSTVLLDVKSGEVLAMVSKPSIWPDDWKGQLSSKKLPYYLPQGKYDPMNPGAEPNRAIQNVYPPGSTFKPITGMAALESGEMNPLDDYVNCTGRYRIAPYIPCWGVHGNVNYYSAMAVSCNVYFQEMGRRAGEDGLVKTAREFGLGQLTGIDIPNEAQGLVPSPEWKKDVNEALLDKRYKAKRKEMEKRYQKKMADAADDREMARLEKEKKSESDRLEAQERIDYNFNTKWQAFDTFNMSIGQGSNNYTVLQLANYTATIANGGNLMKPHLVKSISSDDGVKEIKPELIHKVSVSQENLAETRMAMSYVTKAGGTAHFLFYDFPEEIEVGAKTGTAETGRVGDKDEYHGVFIAFAPADNPQVAFAGVVEYGRHGSESAGWVAKAVFEQYFGIKDHYAEIIEQEDLQKAQELELLDSELAVQAND